MVVVATGFGNETFPTDSAMNCPMFWQSDPPTDESRALDDLPHLVSGLGDGGVQDVLFGSLPGFNWENVVQLFYEMDPHLGTMKAFIVEHECDVLSDEQFSDLYEDSDALRFPALQDYFRARLKSLGTRRIYLCVADQLLFRRAISPINRVLLWNLVKMASSPLSVQRNHRLASIVHRAEGGYCFNYVVPRPTDSSRPNGASLRRTKKGKKGKTHLVQLPSSNSSTVRHGTKRPDIAQTVFDGAPVADLVDRLRTLAASYPALTMPNRRPLWHDTNPDMFGELSTLRSAHPGIRSLAIEVLAANGVDIAATAAM